jgi:hypothetical protein
LWVYRDLVEKYAVIRLENEVGIGPADIDAYARHGSPDRPRAAVPDPGAQRLSDTDLARNFVSNVSPAQPLTQAKASTLQRLVR